MKNVKKLLALLLMLVLCIGSACAENYVTISELRQHVETGWDKGEVILPAVDKFPVVTLQADSQTQNNPLVVTIGTFEESQSGKFAASTRYGRTPPYTTLHNGFVLEAAQKVLNNELNRLLGKSIEDYGLI